MHVEPSISLKPGKVVFTKKKVRFGAGQQLKETQPKMLGRLRIGHDFSPMVAIFQNVNLVQRHSGKTPIVLYQQMSLQMSLQVCVSFIAETMQRFKA